jgi:glutaredoxin 3
MFGFSDINNLLWDTALLAACQYIGSVTGVKHRRLIMTAITIYTKDYCPYCKAAKRTLENKGWDYEEIDVANSEAALTEMLQRSRRRTVPQIFFGDTHIGGYDDLERYLSDGGRLEAA